MEMDIQTTTALLILLFWGLCIVASIGFKIWAHFHNRQYGGWRQF